MIELDNSQTAAASAMRDIYIARQSIYDADLNVVGYEVLYRNGKENRAAVSDGNQATSELLLNAAVEIGLERVVGDKWAFVNLTREFLIGSHPLPLDNQQLVLEILEDVAIDRELIDGVANLVSQQYTLALDDAVFRDDLAPLLKLARIVKVELPAIPRTELASHVRRFRSYPVKLLAEKVETQAEFKNCLQLGFEYFQGFFLSKPQMLQARELQASQAAVLKLLAQLSDPDVTVESLEGLIRNDATISYKLLRYINSSKFGLRRKVESLRQAIVLVGLQGVRTLAMLVSLAGAAQKPGDLLKCAALKALFCEKLGRLMRCRDFHVHFTAGLLSSFDAIFEMPLPEVLKSLPLSDELRNAVLKHEGSPGEAVACAIAHERADWDRIACGQLAPTDIRTAYLTAIDETNLLWSALEM
jgi:EAL and modified HD-GYP domain-containing signal transduction protein